MRFICIADHRPRRTVDLLAEACGARGVEFVHIDAGGYDFVAGPRAEAGDMLYRPAVSIVAQRVEQHLVRRGVATFYCDGGGPDSGHCAPIRHHQRGVPTPRTVFHATRDRALTRAHVAHLGGLPVVVKLLGGEGGVGTMRADSWPGLFSLLDQLHGSGRAPMLMEYVADAPCWRAIVLEGRLLAAYQSVASADDFRTNAAGATVVPEADPPADLGHIAAHAMRANGVEFGGVDILAPPDGRLLVVDANFPCYFPEATDHTGVDVAGPMIDHLATIAAGCGSS